MPQVKSSAYEVIKLKGYTSWSIGMCVSVLCEAILKDTAEVYPVSTTIKGLYGIQVTLFLSLISRLFYLLPLLMHCLQEDVFVSLPSVLTASGVRDVVNINLDQDELAKLNESVQAMIKIQQKVKFD